MNETDARAVTEVLDTAEGDNELLFCHMEGGLIYAAAGQVLPSPLSSPAAPFASSLPRWPCLCLPPCSPTHFRSPTLSSLLLSSLPPLP